MTKEFILGGLGFKRATVLALAGFAILLGTPRVSDASVIYAYSGSITTGQGAQSVDVSATFAISGNTLTIDLRNNLSTPNTTAILTNLEWNITNHDTTTLAHAAAWYTLLGSTAEYTNATTPVTNAATISGSTIQGNWGLASAPGSTVSGPFNAEYVLSAVTGGPFTTLPFDGLGYGIEGPSSNLSTLNVFPIFRSTDSSSSGLEFTLTGVTGISESEIANVKFSFGSHNNDTGFEIVFQDGSLTPTPTPTSANPEPASWLLMGMCMLGIAWYGKHRKTAMALVAAAS